MPAPKATPEKTQTVTAKDIGSLSTSLLNKTFVHNLPTQLLIRAHARVELQHLMDPKNKRLQIAHTNLFLEMELRDIEHFDTDPSFFTPSNTKWPFEFEFDEELIVERFNKKQKVVENNNKKKKGASIAQARFKKLKPSGTIKKKRRRRRRTLFEEEPVMSEPSIATMRETIERNNLLEKHSETLFFSTFSGLSAKVRRIFKNLAVRTWNLQPDSGVIPSGTGTGPRPKKEYWFRQASFPPMGAYQAFMQKTLFAFYRKQTPSWAIQEWDIRLTITGDEGEEVFEKRNYVRVYITGSVWVRF